MIEIMSFRLAAGTDEAAFRAADRSVQNEFAGQQSGLLRRTTARSSNGDWIVIDRWRSEQDSDACAALWGQDQVTATFMAFLDPATIQNTRYAELA
jgi:hypothetical protein